jgi:hypothetical protein
LFISQIQETLLLYSEFLTENPTLLIPSARDKEKKDGQSMHAKLPTLGELVVGQRLELEAAFHFLRNYLTLVYVCCWSNVVFFFSSFFLLFHLLIDSFLMC